jgi:hypothetical protein
MIALTKVKVLQSVDFDTRITLTGNEVYFIKTPIDIF